MTDSRKDTRRRQGGVFPLSDPCLHILEKVSSHPDMTASKFEEVTGLRPSSLVDWHNRKKAARGALVDLCKRLNCWPDVLCLPEETCRAVRAWLELEKPPWEPQGVSVLESLLPAYEPRVPPVAPHWAGRVAELDLLKEAFFGGRARVAVVEGPSGVGKTALARRFLEDLISAGEVRPRRQVLWWTFQEPGSDAFADESLRFFQLDHRAGARPNGVFHLLANLFAARLIVVLDGLEVGQGADGRLQDDLLALFLREAARRDHQSLVLVSSARPVLEVADCPRVLPVHLAPLEEASAVQVLRAIGVTGTARQLRDAANRLKGHPLLLQVVGNSIVQDHGGGAGAILAAGAASPDHLTLCSAQLKQLNPADRRFLQVASLFRQPIHRLALASVFQKVPGPLKGLGDMALRQLVDRLQRLELIHSEGPGSRLVVHALIRQLLRDRLMHELPREALRQAHELIMNHYLTDLAIKPPPYPSLEDLRPYLEAAHHGCKAGHHDMVWQIGMSQLAQGARLAISAELQAFSTLLRALLDFFPEKPDGTPDEDARPLVSSPAAAAMIYRALALACRNVGQVGRSIAFSRRAVAAFEQEKDWSNASLTCLNLAHTYIHRDALEEAGLAADQAIAFARHTTDAPVQWLAAALRGLVEQLRGNASAAAPYFADVPGGLRQVERFGDRAWLYASLALVHAHHRFAAGAPDAREVAETVRAYAAEHHIQDDLVSALVLLGRCELRARRWARAEPVLDEAWEIAQRTESQLVKIDALVYLAQVRLRRKKRAEARACVELVRNFLRPGEFPYWERVVSALEDGGPACAGG